MNRLTQSKMSKTKPDLQLQESYDQSPASSSVKENSSILKVEVDGTMNSMTISIPFSFTVITVLGVNVGCHFEREVADGVIICDISCVYADLLHYGIQIYGIVCDLIIKVCHI